MNKQACFSIIFAVFFFNMSAFETNASMVPYRPAITSLDRKIIITPALLANIRSMLNEKLSIISPIYSIPGVKSAMIESLIGDFQKNIAIRTPISISDIANMLNNRVIKAFYTESIERLKTEFGQIFATVPTAVVQKEPISTTIVRSEGYTSINNYDAPEIDKETSALVKRNAWIRISSPEEFIKILNSKNPEKFFLDNAVAKRNEMIKGAEIELGKNPTLRTAYEAALQCDYSKINREIFRIRDDLTNSPVIGTMALKLALKGNATLLLWYIENVPSDNDDMLNSFHNVYLHTLVSVLSEKPALIRTVKDAFMKPDSMSYSGRRRFKYMKFDRDSNSGLIGITPFQLALMTYNHELIELLIDINAECYCIDMYGNLFLREVAACRYDKSSLIKLLKKVKYDVLKKNINQEDQIDIAIKNKDVYYMAYLLHILHEMNDPRFSEAFDRVKRNFSDQQALLSGLDMLHSPISRAITTKE